MVFGQWLVRNSFFLQPLWKGNKCSHTFPENCPFAYNQIIIFEKTKNKPKIHPFQVHLIFTDQRPGSTFTKHTAFFLCIISDMLTSKCLIPAFTAQPYWQQKDPNRSVKEVQNHKDEIQVVIKTQLCPNFLSCTMPFSKWRQTNPVKHKCPCKTSSLHIYDNFFDLEDRKSRTHIHTHIRLHVPSRPSSPSHSTVAAVQQTDKQTHIHKQTHTHTYTHQH